MSSGHSNMKKLHWTVLSFSLFYVVTQNVNFFASLQYGNHTEVFYYLASVKNFQSLNPTIINVTRWQQVNDSNFYVEYAEHLSQIRSITNYGKGHYEIRQEDDGSYVLLTQHSTCFLSNFLCLSTKSKLRITKPTRSEVGYKEEIIYSCPWVLLKFCFNEVSIQRKFIINKLTQLFHDS